ncbi:hypothetical protein [Paenibacillus puerhi]|uniref:hypothetical protein n=1 Tax=Paenibacillus puerhi TaxID=2692622 RepID=UPI00135CCEC3|nr:hypothetical protein [Paenibacillus puerhi]
MDFIHVGIDLNEIDDAYELVEEKRNKMKDFIEQLALTLSRKLAEPVKDEPPALTTGVQE